MQALHAARMGHSTQLWARSADTVDSVNMVHTNAMLEGHALPESLCATRPPTPLTPLKLGAWQRAPTRALPGPCCGIWHVRH